MATRAHRAQKLSRETWDGDLGTANFKAQQLPLKPFCTHGEQGRRECFYQLILLLPLGLLLPLTGGADSYPGLCIPILGFMKCHKIGADMDTPLFLGFGGDRATQNNTNSHLLEMEIRRLFFCLEVLASSLVNRLWQRDKWF